MSFISPDPMIGTIQQTSPNKLDAAKNVITTVSGARSIFNTLRSQNIDRVVLYSEINGLMKGSPPYDPVKLQEANLEHVTNINDMSAYQIYQRCALAYWNLTNNTQYSTNFEIKIPHPEAKEWANIMAKNWDLAMEEEYPSYFINQAIMESQLVMLGVSPVLFDDELSPGWRPIELARFYIPDQTSSDPEYLTRVCIESEFTIQYLWNCYEEAKNAAPGKTPWQKDSLARLLVLLSNSLYKDFQDVTDVALLEQKVINGDVNMASFFSDSVKIVSMFQEEYDGKVSQYMFHRFYETEDFIFKLENNYESMSEVITIFTMHPGEATIHGNKGIGHIIFSLAQAAIQVGCSIVDMIKWASTPIVKTSSLNQRDVQQIRFYPGVPTDIGTMDLANNNLGANVASVVSGAEYIRGLIQYNIAYGGNDPAQPDPDMGSLNPDQTKLSASREFSVLKNNIMHYYRTKDKLIKRMTTRMLHCKDGYPRYKLSKRWKEMCIEDGVPEVIFQLGDTPKNEMPKHIRVTAARAMGGGSQAAMLMGLNQLAPFVGSMNESEAEAYRRDMIIATMGREALPRYMQNRTAIDIQGEDASVAGLENNAMRRGEQPTFSLANNHRAHASMHMQLLAQTIEALQQQQMTPIEADSIFAAAIPHTGEHMQALSQDVFAQSFLAQLAPQFGQIEKYAVLNRKNAAKMAQAQIRQQAEDAEATQQVLSEEERKTLQVINEERRKDIKLANQNKRQEDQHRTKKKMLEEKTSADINATRRKTDAEVEAKRRKAASTTEMDTENDADERAMENPRAYLEELNGETPIPYDIER